MKTRVRMFIICQKKQAKSHKKSVVQGTLCFCCLLDNKQPKAATLMSVRPGGKEPLCRSSEVRRWEVTADGSFNDGGNGRLRLN